MIDRKTGKKKIMSVIYRNTPYQMDLDKCYMKYVSPDVSTVLTLHDHFRNGCMPFAGGVMDQPAVLLDAFNLVSLYMAEAGEQA
ncbi:MAG: hypothetical protein U9Q07_05580 [Planctomycetota bacterium]|nr:hypothetical protein [Planctomycetota bacterium]